jgi:hypothetical protein
LSAKYSETKIHQFIKAFVESKNGELDEHSDETFTIKYPNQTSPTEYTYDSAVAREKKSYLMTPGTSAFQQILKECLETGILCQVFLNPKITYEALLRQQFKNSSFACEDCKKIVLDDKVVNICVKSQPYYHHINKGKIVSVNVIRKEPVRYFLFYFSASFQNKLRPKNEEIITVLIDEKNNIVSTKDISEVGILKNNLIDFQDSQTRLKVEVFDKLKNVVDKKLDTILKEKLILFDLPLSKEKKSKLRSFDKRLRMERREQVISKKHDFDYQKWQSNYEALLKREEESFITNIAVKFVNLLVINTTKVSFEVSLDNNASFHSSLIIGISQVLEVTCPVCRKTFSEGYATQDSMYVCGSCIRQSIDTGKTYSKRASLRLDETLNEYIEQDSGFVCSVCGKRHSRLLEFKCSYDNSSVCIHHYGLCDICGNVFSKLNLSSTQEFKRKLCPTHAAECGNCRSIIGVEEGRLCKASGKRYCGNCATFAKCSLCLQEYSTESLVDNKCPACNNLAESNDQSLAFITRNFDNSSLKSTKWLVGRNALNTVAVRKSLFSNSLYVIENDKVVYQNSISFLGKVKGELR